MFLRQDLLEYSCQKNIKRVNNYQRFVESKLKNEVFEKDFKHEEDALGTMQFGHLKNEEV
jgi:hypothetical protein